MSLDAKLKHLFPGASDNDWILSDGGSGPFILVWNRAEPQPTDAELSAVTQAQEEAAIKEQKSEERITRLDDTTKALLRILAPKFGMTYAQLRQELRQELKNQ